MYSQPFEHFLVSNYDRSAPRRMVLLGITVRITILSLFPSLSILEGDWLDVGLRSGR
jgi:hypothetical protein